VWQQGFLNYSSIMVAFWGADGPKLHAALNQYHLDIIELERTYSWQLAVLPLALNFHIELCSGPKVRDADSWELPRRYIDRYCTSIKLRTMAPPPPVIPQKRPLTRSQSSANLREPNDDSVVCNGHNTEEGCTFKRCNRKHECSKCSSSTHIALQCKGKK
jgi:hypothetical protein